jgi:hypothetical protein
VVIVNGNAELLQIIPALRAAGGFARLLDGRQQQGNQDRDNRDHHQQLNERERSEPVPRPLQWTWREHGPSPLIAGQKKIKTRETPNRAIRS